VSMRPPGSAEDEGEAEEVAAVVARLGEVLSGRVEVLLEEVPQVFEPTEECVVCLGTETEGAPNAILYQCGHKCVCLPCASKVRRCPLCRAVVAAVLPV
jgi:tRNA(Leu) C34 or U34 (ribose-2'-O)-methylase TrmL